MKISGKHINLRLVEVKDAEFIYLLRRDTNKTQHLSKVEGGIEDQRQWLRKYKERELDQKEFYFMIESKNGEHLGLVRIYDYKGTSFSWGSWLIKEDAPKLTAIESALQVYEFAFYQLGFTQSHFEVQKGNTKVIAFHQRFGARIVNENDREYFFIFSKEEYEVTKNRYKRYL